jgi:hypothetical protein
MSKKDKTQDAKAPKALLKAVGQVMGEAVERVLDDCNGCALSGGCQKRNRRRDHEMVLAAAGEALPWIGGGDVGWPNAHTLVIIVRRGRKRFKCEEVVVVPPEAIAKMRTSLRDTTGDRPTGAEARTAPALGLRLGLRRAGIRAVDHHRRAAFAVCAGRVRQRGGWAGMSRMADDSEPSCGVRCWARCPSCKTVYEHAFGGDDSCPECSGEEIIDAEYTNDSDSLDELLAVGFGDGEPFRGDVYVDYRANTYNICEQEKWRRYSQFLENEIAKSELMDAVRRLKRKDKRDALDARGRAKRSWADWSLDDVRRELEPWIDATATQQGPQAGVAVEPSKTLWGKFRMILRRKGDRCSFRGTARGADTRRSSTWLHAACSTGCAPSASESTCWKTTGREERR